ncbi:protein of unknown function [Pseudomonas mediterranea]
MSELLAHLLEELLDHFFVAFEEVPLTDLLAGDQPSPLQHRQMGRHRGLRQAATLVDLSGADAELVVVQLFRKLDLGVFEPVEDVSPYRVRQCFYYFVEVKGHEGSSQWVQVSKTLYRDEANLKSLFRDIPIWIRSEYRTNRYIGL